MTSSAWSERSEALKAVVREGDAIATWPRWAGEVLARKPRGSFPESPAERVVAIDPEWSVGELGAELKKFSQWPSTSRLVLGFENRAGASALVALLTGEPSPASRWTDDQVRTAIEQAGLTVVERRGFSRGPSAELALETDTALRTLFGQLNESTSADWVLYTLEPGNGQARGPHPYVPGLLSVVMRNHSTARAPLVDQALFSLATQNYRHLEIVLVTQSNEPGATEQFELLLRRHQPLGGYTWRVINEPSTTDIRAKLVNVGIEAARGQYLAILDDDDVVYPNHYVRLIDALEASDKAWAFAPIERSYFTQTPSRDLYCKRKHPMPWSDQFEFARLAYDNYVTCHSYVIDRYRLGRFAVRFEERLDKGEDYAMLLKLVSTFRPVAIGGAVSAEYRIRDNGSNTIIHETSDDAVAARLRREWEVAIALKNELTDPLQMIMSKETFVRESHKGLRPEEAEPPPVELRYRIVDIANDLLKRRLGFLHRALKAAAAPRMGAGESMEKQP